MGSKELRQAGLKVTLPRMKILNILQQQPSAHLTVEAIFQALGDSGEDIGLATVYRALTQFEASGLVKRYHFENGQSVFELNRGAHHDHILCLDCGRIEEFCDEEIERRQQDIAQRLGFELTDHSLILYGHCNRPDCADHPGESEEFDPRTLRGKN
ncbi:MAG: ferric iron uptake transcriptional regulator [Candidatus Contendobacter sp.]|jgi:Fur family ferric uptake transcriptional regulator|nr:ferric iron uptake transcriptional regulator [Gammaproteobacteria bacterium]MCC8994287.1 ferric iron uptake transcriptional regulator [Candidatus Contendobacter sp.]